MPEPIVPPAGTPPAPAPAPTVEELQAQIAAKDAAMAELQAKHDKLAEKNFNFGQARKLAEMTEAERAAMTERERDIMQRQEALEKQQTEFVQSQVKTHKDDAYNVLAGDNKELREKMDFHYARIVGNATTREEVAARSREAFLLATGGGSPVPDAFSRGAMQSAGATPVVPQKALSADQKDLATRLGISPEDLAAYEAAEAAKAKTL